MDDSTDRLRVRRDEIIARLAEIGVPQMGTRGWRELFPLRQELASIDNTLAQLDLAEATRQETAARDAERQRRDDADFWLRRFHVSLAIGNGAGFALVTGALVQSQHLDQALAITWAPMMFFGLGLIAAGALPLVMFIRRSVPKDSRLGRLARWAELWAATMAGGLFVVAVGWSLWTVTAVQKTSSEVAKAQRQVEGAELALRWLAVQRQLHPAPRPSSAASTPPSRPAP